MPNPAALRLPLNFDPALLQADLARVPPQAWQAHFNQRIYEGDWSGAALRAVPGHAIAIYSDPNAQTWEDTPLLGQSPYFQDVLQAFACPLLSVRLLRLGPGAAIHEHADPMLGPDFGEVRLHVVVSTNPAVECRINGVSQHWDAGECWYADFGLPHSFANQGLSDRIHMVLDCGLNDWLKGLLGL